MKIISSLGKKYMGAFVMAIALFVAVDAFSQPEAAVRAMEGASQQTAFKIREMIATGWPILSVLLIMSILSVAIAVERTIVVKRAERETRTFFPEVLKAAHENKSPTQILEFCQKAPHSVSDIVTRMINESDDRESMQRAAHRLIQLKVNELSARTPTLGTVAGTAPFVGLLGTVIGIIKAFQSIATHMGGGPEVVAAGVAEALITTAFGLFVAIPAVMMYNYLGQRIHNIATEIEVSTSELADKLTRKK